MKKQIRGSIMLTLTTIIWGAAFVAQSVGMEHIGPFTFQAIRCFLGVLALLPVIAVSDCFKKDGQTYFRRWRNKKLWISGILCGIPLFFACAFQQTALVDTDPGKAGFLTAMYIVIVPIIGLFRRQRFTITIPLSVLLGVAGLYFLSCVGMTGISTGDLLLLGCALMFAIQITFVDIFAPDVDPLRLNAIQAFICSLFSAVSMIFLEQPTLTEINACWLPLVYAGVLSMGTAYALQIYGQRDVPPAAASLIMSLESVFATLFSIFLLHKWLSPNETIGCALVFTAVIVSQIPVKAKEKMLH